MTPAVLDLLEEGSARATFFCIGERVRRHPEIALEIVRRGHRIENHTERHSPLFALLLPPALGAEIDAAQRSIESVVDRRPVYLRAPAGFRGPWLAGALEERRLTLVSWTRRAFDTTRRDSQAVLGSLSRDLAGGDILVLHDTVAAVDEEGTPMALAVLPALLDEIERRGLVAAPLPEPS